MKMTSDDEVMEAFKGFIENCIIISNKINSRHEGVMQEEFDKLVQLKRIINMTKDLDSNYWKSHFSKTITPNVDKLDARDSSFFELDFYPSITPESYRGMLKSFWNKLCSFGNLYSNYKEIVWGDCDYIAEVVE